MQKFFLLLLFFMQLYASTLQTSLLSVNKEEQSATIKAPNLAVGMSGFLVHQISPNHSAIINTIVVSKYDTKTQLATLKIDDFTTLQSDALPKLTYQPQKGDIAQLALNYDRALIIAPTEEIYYRLNKSIPSTSLIHPDIFTALLSANGHPTPLKEDFEEFRKSMQIGLLFLYLDKKLYTLDAKSFKILYINDAPLKEVKNDIQLPFYSRIKHIEANWFGEGSDELEAYKPYYYELLVEYNKHNKQFYEIVKNSNSKELVDEFEIGEK